MDFIEKDFILYRNRKGRIVLAARGSYTIEASLILFLIVSIILSMIYIGFYEYDKLAIESVCTLTSEREIRYILECSDRENGALNWEDFTEKSILWRILNIYDPEILIDKINERLEGTLFFCKKPAISGEIQRETIKITYHAEFVFPTRWMEKLFMRGRNMTITGTVEISEKESEEFVRLCRALQKGG